MGRSSHVDQNLGVRKGFWTQEEDALLAKCIEKYGEGEWWKVPLRAGLNRCRKSCRLRWMNYLRPNINRGKFATDETDLIIKLHKLLGNRWSLIAGRIPGRTANDIKNYWNCHLSKNLDGQMDAKNGTYYEIVKPHPHKFKVDSKPLMKPFHGFEGLKKQVQEPSSSHLQEDDLDGWSCLFSQQECAEYRSSAVDNAEEIVTGRDTSTGFVDGGVEWYEIFTDKDLWSLLENNGGEVVDI